MNFEDFFTDFKPQLLNVKNQNEDFKALNEVQSNASVSHPMNLNLALLEDFVPSVPNAAPVFAPCKNSVEKKPRFRIVQSPSIKPKGRSSEDSISSYSSMCSSPGSSLAAVPQIPYGSRSFPGAFHVPHSTYHPYQYAQPIQYQTEDEIKEHYRRKREERKVQRLEKSVFTYPNMIFLALLNAPNHQAYVTDIYDFITYNFPFFATAPDSWKNTVRHNLCCNKGFVKVPDSTSKLRGDAWTIKKQEFSRLYATVDRVAASKSVEELKLRNPDGSGHRFFSDSELLNNSSVFSIKDFGIEPREVWPTDSNSQSNDSNKVDIAPITMSAPQSEPVDTVIRAASMVPPRKTAQGSANCTSSSNYSRQYSAFLYLPF